MQKHSLKILGLALVSALSASCAQSPGPITCTATAPYVGPEPRVHAVALPSAGLDLTKHVSPDIAARLEKRFREEVSANKAPAGAIAVYSPDTGYWSSTHGIAPGQSQRLPLASITKMITSAVIFQLADEKKLGLSDTIDRWFPDLPNSKVITIDHLLSHTSGLMEVYAGLTPEATRLFFWPSEEWKRWGGGNSFCPGTRFEYNNNGYVLLGRIAEQIDGETYADIVDRRIAKPLGLTAFGIVRPGVEAALVVPGESATSTWWDLQGKKQSASFLSTMAENPGPGAAFGEMDDTLVFLNAWLTGRLFPAASRDLVLSRMLPWGNQQSWGRGVMMWELFRGPEPSRWFGHNGGMPGANTIAIYDPARNAWAAAVFNIRSADAGSAVSAILSELVPDKKGPFGRIGMAPGPRRGTMRVASVEYDSPAEKAGLKVGDMIVRFDGVIPTVANMEALEAKGEPEPGYVLEILLDDGRTIRIIAAKRSN